MQSWKLVFLIVATTTICLSFFQQKGKNSKRIMYELPEVNDSSSIIYHLAYTLQYNEKYEQADWVAYLLTKEMISGKEKRDNFFRSDSSITTGSAESKDYRNSGYDKGHLAPAADFSYSKEAMSESFYMSNMSPQRPRFNRGIWKKLEELVRKIAKVNDSIYVATGPVLREGLPTIGKDSVAVPEYYYKVIAVYRKADQEHEHEHEQEHEQDNNLEKGIGFILKNRSSNKKLENLAVSIDSVEAITRINFFANIPDSIEDKIEKYVDYKDMTKDIQ